MNTSEFLDALRARPELPLAFSTASGSVPAAFHLTEVKRVMHDTVDCGGMSHTWVENQFELWTPRNAEPDRAPMRAGRFLSIIEKVRRSLSLDDGAPARVFGRIAGGPDQLHDIASIDTGRDAVEVRLEPVESQCKARDRRESSRSDERAACCTMAAGSKIAAMCGCEARSPDSPDSEAVGKRRVESVWFSPFESQGFRFMF